MISNAHKNTSIRHCKKQIVLQGYYKKLKTMKKKYFVLYEESDTGNVCLEYFDNEKKFKSSSTPKRIIKLKNCFNINRRLDTKYDHVLELSTKDGSFDIVMDSEEDINKWLKTLLKIQNEKGQNPEFKPKFEHVWQVKVQRKGLAEDKNIIGGYHVCLTNTSLKLYTIGVELTSSREIRADDIEIYLTSIRRCGDSLCLFYMELGRQSSIGAGELWMETGDNKIAQSMHRMILNAMASKRNDELIGPMRKRSSSANEASKPISVLQRRQTHSGLKNINNSPLIGRDRCDSLPSSQHHTTSECSNQTSIFLSRNIQSTNNRPHSMNIHHSHSPPMSTLTQSSGCSESGGSSLSIDEVEACENFTSFRYKSLSTSGMIPEEIVDEICTTESSNNHSTNKHSSKLENNLKKLDPMVTTNLCQNFVLKNQSINHDGNLYVEMIIPYENSENVKSPPSFETIIKNKSTTNDREHSEKSNSSVEIVAGYVPMAPILKNKSNLTTTTTTTMNRSKDKNLNLSSAPSASSITSETPSVDVNFHNHSFVQNDFRTITDSDEVHDRPLRTYSVGSRLEHNKRKLRVDMFENSKEIDSRTRAFSVGSRKVSQNNVQYNINNQVNNNIINGKIVNNKSSLINKSSNILNRGKKFPSAPILAHKNQNNDRMSDLMEIDFSKNYCNRRDSFPSPPLKVLSNSFKILHPNQCESPKNIPIQGMDIAEYTCCCSNSAQASNGSYLEMKPIPSSINSKTSYSNYKLTACRNNPLTSTVTSSSSKSSNQYTLENFLKPGECISPPIISEVKSDIDLRNHQKLIYLNLPKVEHQKQQNDSQEKFKELPNSYQNEKQIPTLNIEIKNKMHSMLDISNKQYMGNEKVYKSDSSLNKMKHLNDAYECMSLHNENKNDIKNNQHQISLFPNKQEVFRFKEINEKVTKDRKDDVNKSIYLIKNNNDAICKSICTNRIKTHIDNSCKFSLEKWRAPFDSYHRAESDIDTLHIGMDCLSHLKRNIILPDSVKSDKNQSSTKVLTRANSEKINYFPNSLFYSSTLCESSSSSTLCTNKNNSSQAACQPKLVEEHHCDDEKCNKRTTYNDQPFVQLRPTSMNRDLYYASLVLPASSSPNHFHVSSNNEDLNPNLVSTACQPRSSFTYAKIDFNLHEKNKNI